LRVIRLPYRLGPDGPAPVGETDDIPVYVVFLIGKAFLPQADYIIYRLRVELLTGFKYVDKLGYHIARFGRLAALEYDFVLPLHYFNVVIVANNTQIHIQIPEEIICNVITVYVKLYFFRNKIIQIPLPFIDRTKELFSTVRPNARLSPFAIFANGRKAPCENSPAAACFTRLQPQCKTGQRSERCRLEFTAILGGI
jgi:hypothetical protein